MKLAKCEIESMDTKQFLLLTDGTVLTIHLVLLFGFLFTQAYIMAIVNVFSVTYYAFSFFLIDKKKYYLFVTLMYLEIWIHMILAVIFVGWDAGFQLYCFLLLPFIFFTVYVGIASTPSLLIPLIECGLDIAAFLYVRFYTRYNSAYYAGLLSDGETNFFYLFNIAIVFVGLVYLMSYFSRRAIRSERELHELAEYDELTGLYNRRFIRNVLDDVYYDYVSNGRLFAVAITDIDDFKIVNDTYGHDAGDFVLSEMGKIFTSVIPENASLGRWGGEEFIVIFRSDCDYAECCAVMERIRGKIDREPFVYEGHDIKLTLTVGIALYEDGMSITDIVRRADARLYQGKSEGKNTTVNK